MIELVYGGSGSGKSEFAESEILRLSGTAASKRFYIATMKIRDEEARQKAARHKKLREKKDFMTIEALENIGSAAEKILDISKCLGKKSCVLLECLSNLAANEMFLETGEILEPQKVVEKIEAGLEKLFLSSGELVIVSNNVFDDGIEYGKETRAYQEALAALNAFAAARADSVSEVVAGISIKIK